MGLWGLASVMFDEKEEVGWHRPAAWHRLQDSLQRTHHVVVSVRRLQLLVDQDRRTILRDL